MDHMLSIYQTELTERTQGLDIVHRDRERSKHIRRRDEYHGLITVRECMRVCEKGEE